MAFEQPQPAQRGGVGHCGADAGAGDGDALALLGRHEQVEQDIPCRFAKQRVVAEDGVAPAAIAIGLQRDLAQLGLVAPGRTPAPEVERVAAATLAVLAEPDVVRKLDALDLAPRPLGPAAFKAGIAADIARWGPVIRSTGFKLED